MDDRKPEATPLYQFVRDLAIDLGSSPDDARSSALEAVRRQERTLDRIHDLAERMAQAERAWRLKWDANDGDGDYTVGVQYLVEARRYLRPALTNKKAA